MIDYQAANIILKGFVRKVIMCSLPNTIDINYISLIVTSYRPIPSRRERLKFHVDIRYRSNVPGYSRGQLNPDACLKRDKVSKHMPEAYALKINKSDSAA